MTRGEEITARQLQAKECQQWWPQPEVRKTEERILFRVSEGAEQSFRAQLRP